MLFSLRIEVLAVDSGIIARIEEQRGEVDYVSPFKTNSFIVVVIFVVQLNHCGLLSG